MYGRGLSFYRVVVIKGRSFQAEGTAQAVQNRERPWGNTVPGMLEEHRISQ